MVTLRLWTRARPAHAAALRFLPATIVSLLALASPARATLYASTETGLLFQSTNDGVTWTAKGAIPEPEVAGLAPGLTVGTLFAVGRTGSVYRSTDGGTGWVAVGNAGASDCVAIEIARSGALLALTTSGDLSRSTDGGASWTRESNAGASDCAALAVGGKVGGSDTLFAATASGDVARLPSGTAWSTVGSTGFTPAVDLLWVSATLYALTDAGEVLRSTNAAATWSAVGAISQVGMRGLAFSGGKFKAISKEGEVYESVSGASWSSTWIGTTNQVFTTALAPGVPEFLTGIGEPPAIALGFQARPNVFSERVAFVVSGALGDAEIRVFDAAGRLVAERRAVPSGPSPAWDGRLPDGMRAASGVYFARADAGLFTETVRLVLIR